MQIPHTGFVAHEWNTYRLNDCRIGESRCWWWVVDDQILDIAGTEDDKLENVITWRHRSFNRAIFGAKRANCSSKVGVSLAVVVK